MPKVLLSTTTVLPGETLRVELDGPISRLKVHCLGKLYPFFEVGPSAERALIGIPLDARPGIYPLTFKKTAATPAGIELPPETYSVEVTTRIFKVENVNFTPQKNALVKFEHHEVGAIYRANHYLSRDQQWEGPFVLPVEGPVIGEFGLRRMHNGNMEAGFHKGIDLRAPANAPVRAAAAGTVVLASHFKAHGNTVLINHGQGVMTIYLHMRSISVKVRQKVKKGQTIGKVGATGMATAPHVHFQVFVHGVPVDPKQWVETEM